MCPVGTNAREPHLESLLDVPGSAERIARLLTEKTMQITLLAKKYRESSVQNPEVEAPGALSLEASAFTSGRPDGIDRPFRPQRSRKRRLAELIPR